jgi:heme exporter protein B
VFRDAVVVAGKDLRIELRSRVVTNQVLPFAALVLLLFGFALDAQPRVLASTGGGLYWAAVLFAAVLAVQRSVAIEADDAAGEALRTSGIDPASVFIGKAAALAAELLALETVLGCVMAILYHLDVSGWGLLAAVAVLATAGLASAGTIYGALSASMRVRETLLPLLFLPVVAPVLLSAARAWQLTLSHHQSEALPWLRILGAFGVIYSVVGVFAYEPLTEAGG